MRLTPNCRRITRLAISVALGVMVCVWRPWCLAVRNDFAVRPAHDDFEAVQGDAAPLMEGINYDADNLGAVGEVDVGEIALTAAHGSGVDGAAFRHVIGNNSGESVASSSQASASQISVVVSVMWLQMN